MATLTASEKIRKILEDANAEVKKLTEQALTELQGRLKEARAVVSDIEAEIAYLGGKPAKAGRRGRDQVGNGRTVSPKELEGIMTPKEELPARALAKSFETTTKQIVATAKANPDKFKVIPNGPQPKIKRL